MKRNLRILLSITAASLASARADTIALWTFESPNAPATITGSTITGILPAVGSGTASGVHASASTDFSSKVGNGSASALDATRWAAGDYWQFRVSTVGFAQIQLSFDQTAFDNGPTNFNLLISTDGVNFETALAFYGVLRNSTGFGGGGTLWNPTTQVSAYTRLVDLSAFTSLDDSPDVYFRLVDNITSPSMFQATAYGRIDNFEVTGTPVPEPSVVALGAGLLLAMALRRRWR